MPTNNRTIFKRLNFFTGFFTTAEDWLQGQDVSPGEAQAASPWAAHTRHHSRRRRGAEGDGRLAVSACGWDPARPWTERAICSTCLRRKTIPITLPEDLPKTVYIYIKYAENPTDSQYNVDYPEYSGPSRVSENPEITSSPDEPGHFDGVVLASIALQPGVTEVIDAANNASPGPNEIDTRAATLAGAVDWRRDALPRSWPRSWQNWTRRISPDLNDCTNGLQKVHEYHLAKQRRHNKGLYEPGLMPDVLDELAVPPVGGLDVEVRPGAALDGAGNELYLDQAVQLSIPPPTAPRRVYILPATKTALARTSGPRITVDVPPGSGPLVAAPPSGGPPGSSRYRTLKVRLADAAPRPDGMDRVGAHRSDCRSDRSPPPCRSRTAAAQ